MEETGQVLGWDPFSFKKQLVEKIMLPIPLPFQIPPLLVGNPVSPDGLIGGAKEV